ncbi:TetR family transcriptional regulator [Mycolicibacterium canariasense]|uniref:TetR family transcriptional regulator n=1 Tax=Mycolicibacterium canariasense TaxID=228230 RepID=A0A100W8Z7_MYCCR|nr:TetR/AcrR family transcriptional regulator [Mycolicibacterium canariasense]MCV7212880.1 TetR/AcrR family transcriptional regulator [Mycolicibacterium canariasense]ORV19281.1 TetR family transcriptional regulator [Mycolicibacterium canariasense]GAS93852.1 TetR family transcriptional regulator [Mycolicibacterium canariasense]
MDLPERSVADSAKPPVNRLERRKLRTRNALVRAAQGFIAQGKLGVPILEITQAADVGMGSFYNHFSTKEELFEAAVTDALDDLGAILDSLTGSISDPAEAFAANYRLSGRLFRYRPQEAALLLAHGDSLILSNRGLSPRALRDITAAIGQKRFTIADPELGLAIAGGMFVGLVTLLRERPERDTEATVDLVTERLLRTLGMTPKQAEIICRKPLPDISSLRDSPNDWPVPMAPGVVAHKPD